MLKKKPILKVITTGNKVRNLLFEDVIERKKLYD